MRHFAFVVGVLAVVGMSTPALAQRTTTARSQKPPLVAPPGATVVMEAHLSEDDLLPIIRDFVTTAVEVAKQAIPSEVAGQLVLPSSEDIQSILSGLRSVDVLMLHLRRGSVADVVKFYEPDLKRRGLYPLFRMADPDSGETALIMTAPGLRESFVLFAEPEGDGLQSIVVSIDGMLDIQRLLAWVRENAGALAMVARELGPMFGRGGPAAPEGPVIGFVYDQNEAGEMVVVQVVPDSLAAKAGMEVGDIIVAVDGERVADLEVASERIGRGKRAGRVVLLCKRGDVEHEFVFAFKDNHDDD